MKRKTRKIKIRQDSAKIIFVDILPQKTEFVYTLWKNFVDVGIFSFIFDIFSAVLLCNFVTKKRFSDRKDEETTKDFSVFYFLLSENEISASATRKRPKVLRKKSEGRARARREAPAAAISAGIAVPAIAFFSISPFLM